MAMTGVSLTDEDGINPTMDRQPGHCRYFDYQALATRARLLNEIFDDAACSVPILERRRNSQPGKFNTKRLKALQQFVLGFGGAGLSRREQQLSYNFLSICDDHGDLSPMDVADESSLRAVLPSASAFFDALRVDIDDAALDDGWRKVCIKEGGIDYEAYFLPVLELVMKLLRRSSKRSFLWSGKDGPAPTTDRRERLMDGDAFQLCEQQVIEANGLDAFVLGLHLYSDGSRLPWSGGMLVCRLVERASHARASFPLLSVSALDTFSGERYRRLPMPIFCVLVDVAPHPQPSCLQPPQLHVSPQALPCPHQGRQRRVEASHLDDGGVHAQTSVSPILPTQFVAVLSSMQ